MINQPISGVIASLGGLLSFLCFSPPTLAAEQVILKYSIFQESISIQELGELSRTGKVSPELRTYLNLANKEPEELRQWLNQPFPVSSVTLSKVLNSFAGVYILNQVGDVIHTPSQRASKQALRGAIISSAVDDNEVQLIEVLENYPTPEVHVEGDRLVALYENVQDFRAKLPF